MLIPPEKHSEMTRLVISGRALGSHLKEDEIKSKNDFETQSKCIYVAINVANFKMHNFIPYTIASYHENIISFVLDKILFVRNLFHEKLRAYT
jgi:hypothetical protein